MLVDAGKIAVNKVIESFINILIFRNVSSWTRQWLSGFWAFVATIFIANKIKNTGINIYHKLEKYLFPEREKKKFKFDLAKVESAELGAQNIDKFNDYLNKNALSDLFNHIFESSSRSALISLLALLSIESMVSKYQMDFLSSMVWSVFVSFIVCFGSSLKYSNILIKEWLDDFELLLKKKKGKNAEAGSKSSALLLTYNIKDKIEYIGLWSSKYDSHEHKYKVEIKFMNPFYTPYIAQIFDYYMKNHMKIHENPSRENPPTPSASSKNEKYDLVLPDYYNNDRSLEKDIKNKGFGCKTTWTEFRLVPLSDFSIKVYQNYDIKIRKYLRV